MSSCLEDYIVYDGINSRDLGLLVVEINSGMIEMPFGYSRSILEEEVGLRDTPYFFGVKSNALELEITFCNDEFSEWDMDTRWKINRWLYKDRQYKTLTLGDNRDVVYYCMPVGDPKRYDNGNKKGYITIKFRCNGPFPYTKTAMEVYDYTKNPSNTIEIRNMSNVLNYYYPEVMIEMTDDTEVSIINLTNNNEEFKFIGLKKGEKIYINNDLKQIKSSLEESGIYRLNNFNKNWFRLVQGKNRIQIKGNVKVVIRTSYPISL